MPNFTELEDFSEVREGGQLVAVPPHNTSITCPRCQYKHSKNRNGIKFKCLSCRFKANADRVGSVNVLTRGLRVIACGEKHVSL